MILMLCESFLIQVTVTVALIVSVGTCVRVGRAGAVSVCVGDVTDHPVSVGTAVAVPKDAARVPNAVSYSSLCVD